MCKKRLLIVTGQINNSIPTNTIYDHYNETGSFQITYSVTNSSSCSIKHQSRASCDSVKIYV